jgi:LacI family transcriptional regulator
VSPKQLFSLVLRNSPSIPARTRERVLDAAKRLGYVYNRGAASLRLPHTRMIGMAVNDLTKPYFAEIVAAIEDALTAEPSVPI